MTEKEFGAFVHNLDELVRTKKPNEQIAVDIYNAKGELVSSSLSEDDEYMGYRIISF